MPLTLASYERLIKWGSCSWNYLQGWKGVVYHGKQDETDLPLFQGNDVLSNGTMVVAPTKMKKTADYGAELLSQYCAYKHFSTLCFDMTHYRPFSAEELAGFAQYLTPGFPVVIKVWDAITKIGQWQRIGKARYERRSNDNFLNPRVFVDQFLPPYRQAFAEHVGMFLFEFMRLGYFNQENNRWVNYDPRKFNQALDQFLGALPKDFRYAVEIRDRNLVNAEYAQVLRAHGVAHFFNQWESMLSLEEQFDIVGFTANFAGIRVLTPPRVKYAVVQKSYAPYDRIHERLPKMRAGIVSLIERALSSLVYLNIVINNRAEGHAPATVRELDGAMRMKLSGG